MREENILQACIFLPRNSEHKQYQNDLIEICTIAHRRDSCMKGVGEVLDEGVGDSLTTHLQEM